MKNQSFLFFISLLLLTAGSFIGCNGDGGGGSSQETQALTENDFANDPSLRADPEKHLIVKFLEHPDSDKPENDTGEVGNDTIPHTYTRTLNHTFCWEDDDADAEHFMILEDSDGNEILRLDVGDCVTEVIVAGDYVMIIFHDGRIETTHAIFIIPGRNGGLGAKKEETIPEGIVKRAGRILSTILEKLDISITQTTNAQTATPTLPPTVEDNINTLLSSKNCRGCNLAQANLVGANLVEADLSPDEMGTPTSLFEANLGGARLNGANLTEASLVDAILAGAFLNGANLTGANLIGADLSATTWCDGRICTPGSTGTCVLMVISRFFDNCDGTISMDGPSQPCMWEKKTGSLGPVVSCTSAAVCPDPHDVNNTYTWNSTGTGFDGTVSTVFLAQLNDVAGGGTNCFAGHCDWRLPEQIIDDDIPGELELILDLSQGFCGGGIGACINPIFGPTADSLYWTGTTFANNPNFAWSVNFADGNPFILSKRTDAHVRALRLGCGEIQ